MGDRDRVQGAFQGLEPEGQETIEDRKSRTEVVILPDIGLQQPGVIGAPIEDARGGQSVAFELPFELLFAHRNPPFRALMSVLDLEFPLQASKMNLMFIIKALAASMDEC